MQVLGSLLFRNQAILFNLGILCGRGVENSTFWGLSELVDIWLVIELQNKKLRARWIGKKHCNLLNNLLFYINYVACAPFELMGRRC